MGKDNVLVTHSSYILRVLLLLLVLQLQGTCVSALESNEINSNYISQTKAGVILPTLTGGISFISSILVIYIVKKLSFPIPPSDLDDDSNHLAILIRNDSSSISSNTYISTSISSQGAYHRIVACISFADMISSLSIAITTIPMPKNFIQVYPGFSPGYSYGSVATCEAQGFLYLLGVELSFSATSILSLYYLLTIRYDISDQTIKTRLQPCALLIALGLSGFHAVSRLQDNLINPVPFVSWCVEGDYPYGCREDDEVQCIRGEADPTPKVFILLTLILGATIQVISMIMVVMTVHSRRNREICSSSVCEDDLGRRTTEDERIRATRQDYPNDTMVVMKQCFFYFAAFIATHLFTPQLSSNSDSVILQVLVLVLKPLQGFFNAAIFIYHKVYMLRHVLGTEITFCEALRTIIRYPTSIPTMVVAFDKGADHDLIKEETSIVENKIEARLISMNGNHRHDVDGASIMINSFFSGSCQSNRVNSAIALDDYPDDISIN